MAIQVEVIVKRKRENIKSNNRNAMLKSKEWTPTPKSVAEERNIYPSSRVFTKKESGL